MQLEILRLTRPCIVCDKCGLPTLAGNSRASVSLPTISLCTIYKDRHIFPVLDTEGSLICPGSPSVRQYLSNQPQDMRPEFPLDPTYVMEYQEAFFQARYRGYDHLQVLNRTKSLLCPVHKQKLNVHVLAAVSEGLICRIRCQICDRVGFSLPLVIMSHESKHLSALDPEDYALMGGNNFVIAAGGSV